MALYNHKKIEIAVMCWFPTKGDPFPVSFKIKENDEIHTVKDIHISNIKSDLTYGNRQITYDCEAAIQNTMKRFQMVFFVDICKWYLLM